jgi:hypothetical protein
MAIVDELKYEGVSASVAANLDAIAVELIRRKRGHENFDCILVYDISRFSRSGAKHAAKMRWDLEQAGIDVITVIGYQPPNPYSDIVDTFGAAQAREQARSIAGASARGAQSSLERGTRAHCTKPPYGVNRLVLSESGEPLFILQNEADGSQLRLAVDTGEVLERYPQRVGNASGHYKKSAGQRVALVPGRPEHVDIVRQIFRRHAIDGWGFHRIAQELNDQGIPSAKGSMWHKKAVRDILNNPVYCGAGLANARTQALYFRRASGTPTDVGPAGRRVAGSSSTTYRPAEDWVWVEEERMAGYLPDDLRERALRRQRQYLLDRATGVRRRPKKDKHINSLYILKGVLRTPDGVEMTGQTNKHRYYIHSRSHTAPKTGTLRPRVRAEAVEEPILARLRQMLLLIPHLRASILEKSHEWAESRHAGDGRAALEKRLASLDRRIAVVLSVDAEDEVLRQQLTELVTERNDIKQRLSSQNGLPHLSPPEIEEVVDLMLENLQMLGRFMGTFDPSGLRKLVEVFVESAVFDPETREVSIVLRVPSWAMAEDRMMGLGDPLDSKSIPEAHRFLDFQDSFEIPKCWQRAANGVGNPPPG